MATCVGFLDPVTGRLSDIRYGDPVAVNEVLVLVMPTGDGPFTYDSVNHLAVNAKRMPRTIQDITTDMFITGGGLSTAQKNAIITNLFGVNSLTITGASTPLIKSDVPGLGQVFLSALFASKMVANGDSVFVSQGQQLLMAAWYCIDNPSYLVHPAFDPTINIPGDQPAL